jgi:hypothetical protein
VLFALGVEIHVTVKSTADTKNKLLARCAEKLDLLEAQVLQVVCGQTLSIWLAIVNDRRRTLSEESVDSAPSVIKRSQKDRV